MILIAILVVGVAFVMAEYRNKNIEKEIYSNTTISTSSISSNAEGNTDWKSILLTNDLSPSTTTKDLTKNQEKLTATDILGRDFFARYMELKQLGSAQDTYSQQELVSQVLRNGIVLSSPKTYTLAEIKINNDYSSTSLKAYGSEVGNIFKIYTISSRNEAVITRDAIEKEDPAILKELDPILKSYKNILNGLIKVRVPANIVQNHLDLINSVSALVYIVENFQKSAKDPLAGVQATSLYLGTIQSFSDAINNIKNKLNDSQIIYSPYEGGSFFNFNK